MSILSIAAVFSIALLAGCSVRQASVDPTSYLPNYRPVPGTVIARLPKRIELLPETKSMSGSDFLGALDLEDYGGNISGSVRFNSHFMQLDSEHELQIRCDPDSLIITKESIDRILNSLPPNSPSTRFPLQEVSVVGCTLRKNWDEVVVNRWLANSKTEQAASSNP